MGLMLLASTLAIASLVHLALSKTREDIIRHSAEKYAHHWTAHISSNTPRFEAAFANVDLDEDQRRSIAETQRFGDIFRFKLFSPEGYAFFISDLNGPSPGTAYVEDDIPALVARTGVSRVYAKRGGPGTDRPMVYAEAYVPVRNGDGRIVGIMEVYIDMTLLDATLDGGFRWLKMVLPMLAVLVYLVPATGVFVIATQKRYRDIKLAEARRDPLTGALSRGPLMEEAEAMFQRVADRSDRIGVLFLDLDRFKQTNDTYGHAAGDEVLRMLAERVRETCRQDDIFGRIGGDEFVLLLPGVDEKRLADCAADLCAALAGGIEHAGLSIATSASIGGYVATPSRDRLDVALSHADAALFEAKSRGRGGAVVGTHTGEDTSFAEVPAA